jgi:hypothetical protein
MKLVASKINQCFIGLPLSVVSQRYNVVQPREILEFYRDFTEVSGFELETAGVLKGGKKIWALAHRANY